MKLKTKHLVVITLILMLFLIVSLTTFSSANTNFEVKDVNVTLEGTKAKVEWSMANEADGYEIYLKFPSIGYQTLGTTKGNKVNIIGFKEGETYQIKIRAYKDESGSRVYSNFSSEVMFQVGEGIVTTKLGKVNNVKSVLLEYSATLSWDKVTNAQQYEIYASYVNGKYVKVGTTEDTEVRLIGISHDKAYSIKIRPFLETNGTKVYGTFSDPIIIKYNDDEKEEKPDKVKNLNVVMYQNSAKLTWDELSDIDGYEVSIKVPGPNSAIYNTNQNKITLGNLTEGYTYTVKVRAYKYIKGEKVYGDYSNSKNIEYKEKVKVDKVTDLSVEVEDNRAEVEWDRVSNANGYEILIYVPDKGEYTYTTTENSKTITGLKENNTNYWIKVRAFTYNEGEKVYGDYSSKVYFRCEEKLELNKVKNLEVSMNKEKATFEWRKVENADGYEIEIYYPGYGYSTYTTTKTSKTINGFTNKNNDYTVRVRAYAYDNGEKVYGDYSNKEYFRNEEELELDKVSELRVKRTGDAARFVWNKVENADGYEIILSIPGIGDCVYTQTSTSRYMTGFTKEEYSYRIKVRAYAYQDGKKIYGDYSSIASF